MSNVKESYSDLVATMRNLGAILIPATSAQYEAPPGSPPRQESVSGSTGVRNPTLDIVLEPRRLALSEAITATDHALRRAGETLAPHVTALQQAVARWEGQEGPAK